MSPDTVLTILGILFLWVGLPGALLWGAWFIFSGRAERAPRRSWKPGAGPPRR